MPRGATRRPARHKPRLRLAVQYAHGTGRTPAPTQVRKWVRAALEHDACITVRIAGRNEACALNRNYRGRNHATNILTFVMHDVPPYAGDLVLCAPVVAREAREQGKSLQAHYAHLVIHGVLHMQGYDHVADADARVMEPLESRIVMKLGYPDPYGSGE